MRFPMGSAMEGGDGRRVPHHPSLACRRQYHFPAIKTTPRYVQTWPDVRTRPAHRCRSAGGDTAGEPFPATSFKRHPVRAIQHDHAAPVWLGGLGGCRVRCSIGALVGAVRGRIRNCCTAYTRPGVRRKWGGASGSVLSSTRLGSAFTLADCALTPTFF